MESEELLRYPIGRYVIPEAYTREQLDDWMDLLSVLPSWLDAVIENLDEYQLSTPYREGGWTVSQLIHHIADSHTNALIRLKLTLTEDTPQIQPYNQDAWVGLPDVTTEPVNVSITLLHALHRRMLALLRGLDREQLERSCFHPEHQRLIPVWELIAMYAWHSRHHTEHIKQLRLRKNW